MSLLLRRADIVLSALLLISLPHSALSQKTEKENAGAAPSRTTILKNLRLGSITNCTLRLVKGDRIQFEGAFDESLGELSFTLRSGGKLLLQETFEKQWKLLWDTSKETETSRSLWVYYSRPNGQEAPLAHILVEIYPKSPFQVAVKVPEALDKAPVVIKVTATGSLTAEDYALQLDGKPVEAAFDHGEAKVDMANQLPGKRAFVVVARLSDGDKIASDPVEALLPYRVELLPITEGPLPSVGKFPLHIKADPDLKIKEVEYFVDGTLLGTSNAAPFIDIALNTAHLTPGDHTLHAAVTTKTGERYLTPVLVVTATKSGRKKIVIDPPDPDDENKKVPPPDPNGATDFSTWRTRFEEYLFGQSRSLGVVLHVLNNRYESTASVDDAIAAVNKELAFARPRKYTVAQMPLPNALADEDKRTLEKAQRQLSQSFILSIQALRGEMQALLLLRHYDGNPDNAPADVLFSLRSTSVQASRSLAEATRLANQAKYNLELVGRRSGRRN